MPLFKSPKNFSPENREVTRRLAHLIATGEFSFPGMLPLIAMPAGSKKYEEIPDLAQWALTLGEQIPSQLPRPDAPNPDVAHSGIHSVLHDDGKPLKVALFGDWGTGLYYSAYIARQMANWDPHVAVHLGDVYYAGRKVEYVQNYVAPLSPLLGKVPVYALPGNHDLYTQNGRYYKDTLTALRDAHPATQHQRTSSFCLVGEHVSIVAVDTDWHGMYTLHSDVKAWAHARLAEARAAGRRTVLLTQNQPYSYEGTHTTRLVTDAFAAELGHGMIDLWFWGNEHYCAVYGRGADTPFAGACLGHAGHPEPRSTAAKVKRANVKWVEDAARFPWRLDVRRDQLSNGFGGLEVESNGTMRLTVIDWMRNTRSITTFDGPVGHVDVVDVERFAIP